MTTSAEGRPNIGQNLKLFAGDGDIFVWPNILEWDVKADKNQTNNKLKVQGDQKILTNRCLQFTLTPEYVLIQSLLTNIKSTMADIFY